MERLEFASEHALAEASVARPQDRSSIGGELLGDTKTRRPEVPGVKRAPALHNHIGLVPIEINPRQVLTVGPVVVESYAGIDRQLAAHSESIGREGGDGEELAADVGGIGRDGLR